MQHPSTHRWPSAAAAFDPPLDVAADCYRRRIRVESVAAGTVVADLEDDFHRFRVTLRHDGARVLAAEAESVRWPWTTCAGAAEPLRALAGMALEDRFTAAACWTEPRQNCTHQFDTACHAITHAATGRARRQYDVEVPARAPGGEASVRLWVDGRLRLAWRLDWSGIVDPEPPFDAAPWRGGFMRWADSHLRPEPAEAAIVLRRGADIGLGRGMDLDGIPVASQLPPTMAAVCHTMQPATMGIAFRNTGQIRDFAAHPERLLPDEPS